MSNLAKRFPVYAYLLRLYPRAYQEKYGAQMLQTLADMLDAAPSRARRTEIWLRLAFDVPISAGRQQLSFAGHALTHETPQYVRRNTLISAAFFLPFFVIVIANDLTAHGLYGTWLWSFGVLFTWIVCLPTLGLLVSAMTLLAWLSSSRKSGGSWLSSLLAVRRTWPLLALIALGAGILLLVFFHDSVHCVLGNPIRELHNPRDTLRCIAKR